MRGMRVEFLDTVIYEGGFEGSECFRDGCIEIANELIEWTVHRGLLIGPR